jgi:hypothetical protein
VPILPFVFERLFSTFLLLDSSIKACAYPRSRDDILKCREGTDEQVIAASFMDLIDEIDRRGKYDARDKAVFRAIQALKLRLYGRVLPGPLD